jgi:tRNA pseudouridine55 synthase
MITDRDKTYIAVCRLGITTDTQDITGNIIKSSEVKVDLSMLEQVIGSYIGEYLQLPPMYSAIKVGGKKLYELARQGKEIERESRPVMIKDIRILEFHQEIQEFKVRVDCGKGTYIRTLLHDIGDTLGCGGTMISLLRSGVGNFHLEDALKLSELEALVKEERLLEHLLTIDEIFSNYPRVDIAGEYDKLVHNGNAFSPEHSIAPVAEPISVPVRVYDSQGQFIGIYQYNSEKATYRPVKMFL